MLTAMVRWGKPLRDCCWLVLAVVASDTELFGLMPLSEPIAEGTMIHLHHEEEREIIVATTRTLPSKELLLEGDYRLKTEWSIVRTPVIAHFGIVLVWFPSRTNTAWNNPNTVPYVGLIQSVHKVVYGIYKEVSWCIRYCLRISIRQAMPRK